MLHLLSAKSNVFLMLGGQGCLNELATQLTKRRPESAIICCCVHSGFGGVCLIILELSLPEGAGSYLFASADALPPGVMSIFEDLQFGSGLTTTRTTTSMYT